MSKIRTARIVILVLLVAFAAVIGVVIWRSAPPPPATLAERPVPPPPEEMAVEGTVESAASGFLFTEERDGTVVTRLQAGRMLGIEGGSRVLGEVVVQFRPDPAAHPEQVAEIRGGAGRFDAAASSVELQGNVVIRLASGEWLETSAVRYDLKERVAETDREVTFHLDTVHGSAVGMRARLGEEHLELRQDVLLSGTEDGSGRRTEIRAEHLEHDGAAGRTALGGQVSLAGDWGRFQGRGLSLSDAETGGDARSPAPGVLHLNDADGGERFLLSADGWVFHLSAGREIEALEALGNARLTPGPGAPDLPLEELSAPRILIEPALGGQHDGRLLAYGDAGQPVLARLPDDRLDEVSAARLTLENRPQGQGWARFEESVRARGPGRTLRGEALLLRQDRSVELIGSESDPAEVVEPDRAMTARRILYDREGNGHATGTVHFNGRNEEAAKPLAVVADEARYTAREDTMLLSGQVRAWQGSDSLRAAWLSMERRTGILRAGGGVTASIGPQDGDEVLTEPGRARVQAQDLLWEKEAGKAHFTGQVTLTRQAMRLEAQRLDLDSLADDDYAFTAAGQVKLWNDDWIGTGDRLSSSGEDQPYALESDSGTATVTSLSSGSVLRGARLLIHTGESRAEVDSLPGGRITIRSPGGKPGEAGL